MKTEKTYNTNLYGCAEKTIKNSDLQLYNKIIDYCDSNLPFKQKFYLYENSLDTAPICYCGSNLKFIDMKKGFREFCSKRCMYDSKEVKENRKITNIKKYGVDNPSKSDIVKNKVKNSNNIKFGVDYPLQSNLIVEKSKKVFMEKYGVSNPSKIKNVRTKAELTMLEKYGVRHAMQSIDIKENLKDFFIDKYGVTNPFKLKDVRNKAELTMLKKYGVRHALQNQSILNKVYDTNIIKYGFTSFTMTTEYSNSIKKSIFVKNSNIINNNNYSLISLNTQEYTIRCEKCNNNFTIQRQLYRNRVQNNENVCLNCNPINTIVSNDEADILLYIKQNYTDVIKTSDRTVLDGKELDIYLTKLNLAIEFNGLYWHSELNKNKDYHLNKTNKCAEKNVELIHIWEDDWNNKQDIVKSIILNKLGKSEKIFARKCLIKTVNNKETRDFLVKNHIQGFLGSKIKLGLYYRDELVSLMTFGQLRKPLGQSAQDKSFELLRFCNKLNYSVTGGASKLFKYFLENYDVKDVISYSDNSRSIGNLYKQLKFNFIHESTPNYFWCKNSIRYNRYNFRKDKLVKDGFDINKSEVNIMYERGYFRIFDCGTKKWIYKNKS